MELVANGRFISLGVTEGDPFLDAAAWKRIVEEATGRFPGVDLILYRVGDAYFGLASLSEKLDPMTLAIECMSKGFICVGSTRKVNLMTDMQLDALLAQL